MEWTCNSDDGAKKGVQNSDGTISWEEATCKTQYISHILEDIVKMEEKKTGCEQGHG
jgi:hypothetical protein